MSFFFLRNFLNNSKHFVSLKVEICGRRKSKASNVGKLRTTLSHVDAAVYSSVIRRIRPGFQSR